MLDPRFPDILCDELADEARIPQLGRDAEVLAAAHEGVGLAAFGGGGYVLDIEIGLFAAGYGYESRKKKMGMETVSICVFIDEGAIEDDLRRLFCILIFF